MTARVLAATNESLQVVLDSAVTTNELQCTAHWADETGSAFTEGSSQTNTNGTTAVTLVAAPAASTRRLISDFTVYNRDTVQHTVTVQIDVGGTPYILYRVALSSISTLNFDGSTSGDPAWYDKYDPSPTDPVSPTPVDGDHYYNTALHMMMQYDSSRSKWLSIESALFSFGRNGDVPVGGYYRGINGMTLSATNGYPALHDGTIVEFGYSRSDSDAAPFEVTEDGTTRSTIASSATSGISTSLNDNISSGGIIAVRNQTGGNTTTRVQGWVKIKWRV